MKPIIQSQYLAALAMLGDAVGKCDEALWTDPAYKHPFWRVAYHTLFYADLYLSESEGAFQPWEKHLDELQSLGLMRRKDGRPLREGPAYSRADLEAYGRLVKEKVAPAVEALDLDRPSGFYWLPFTKLGLQFYNIRHIQHHTGQLAERIRQRLDQGVGWVRSG